MSRLARTTLALRPGRLECFGPDLGLRSETAQLILAEDLGGRSVSRPIALGGENAWLKAGPLRGRASKRHMLRGLVGLRLPRLCEHANLDWLAERLFRVPVPLACGFVRRHGLPIYQFLVTRRLERVTPLDELLPKAKPELRGALVSELAREAARMHALHFVHHDLYVRNLLVTPEVPTAGDQRRLVFLDAWRGGPGYLPRGPDYDLACLMVEGAALFTPFEQGLFFREYLAERAVQGRAPDRARLLAAVGRGRAALMARIAREPGRWRGPGAPIHDWQPPAG